MRSSRLPFVFILVCLFSSVLFAGRTDITLDPDDWMWNGAVGDPSTLTQTPEGYLRVTCNRYRGHINFRTEDTYNVQGATVRYKWRVNCYGQYSWTQDGMYPWGRMSTKSMTTHHSWAGSQVISNNTWIYTEIYFNTDRTWSAEYCYNNYASEGGSRINYNSGTISDTNWDHLANSFLSKLMGDGYSSSFYYEIAEAYFETPGISVEITTPADPCYFEVGTSVLFEAQGSLGTEPYSYTWSSDIDGEIGTGASFSTDTLSGGEHIITVTCVDDANEVGTDTVTVGILEQPIIEDIASITVTTSEAYQCPVPTLLQGDTLVTWSLIEGPVDMTIDPATGVVTWLTPDPCMSPATITIRAENPVGTDDETWVLSVIETPGFASEIWSDFYDGAGIYDAHDFYYKAAIDSQGNTIAVGYVDSQTIVSGKYYYDDAHIAKYGPDGTILWEKVIAVPYHWQKAEYNDRFENVAVDSQDNIICVGTKSGTFSSYYLGSYHNAYWVVKYDPNGVQLWEKAYHDGSGSAWQGARGVAIDHEDNVIVTGSSFGSWSGPEHQWLTFKYDPDGNVIWGPVREDYKPGLHYLPDYAYDCAVDSVGDVICVGIRGVSGTDGGIYNNFDWQVNKYNGANGAKLWSDTYAGAAGRADYARGVTVDSNDDVLVVGQENKGSDNSSNANYDWLMIKYAKDGVSGVGQRLWTKTWESAPGRSEACYGAAPDQDGNFLVVGSEHNGSVGNRRLAKVSGIDGTLLGAQVWPSDYSEYIYKIDRRNELIALAGLDNNGVDNNAYVSLMTISFAVIIHSPSSHSYYGYGDPISFEAEMVGEADPPYIYTWSSSLDGVLGTGQMLEVSDLSVGEHTITCMLEYGEGETLQSHVVVFVVDPPVIDEIPDENIVDEQPYTGPEPVLLQGDLSVVWSLIDGPAGMTIDEETGIVDWADPCEGLWNVTIQAQNPAGLDQESWQVEVVAIPDIDEITNESVMEFTEYTGPTPTLAKGTTPITWSLVDAPVDMTIDELTGVVTWESPLPSFTAYNITIMAQNDAGDDTESWSLVVLSAPFAESLPDDVCNEGQSYTGPTPVLEKGTAPVTWTLEAGPAGMDINGSTGVVSWVSPNADGSPHTVTIRATNDYGFHEVSYSLTVIRAPIVVAILDDTILEGSTYTGPLPSLSQGTEPIQWALITGPAGMGINTSTGVVTWPNVPAVEGPHDVTIRASNSAGTSDASWQITVHVIPEIQAMADESIPEGNDYTSPAPTLVKGTEPVTWSAVSVPTGAVVDPGTGVVTWNGTTATGTPHSFTIQAGNDYGSDTVTWELDVVRAPAIGAIDDASVTKGQTYVGPMPSVEEEMQPLTWSLNQGPAGMTIHPTTGVVTWSGSPVAGFHTIEIQATNIAGSDTETWELEVIAPPILDTLSNDSVMEYTAYTGPTPALIEGTAPITWSLDTGPAGMTIDEVTGVVSWDSAEPSLNPYTVIIRASNAVGADTVNYQLTVLSPPQLNPLSDNSIAEGANYTKQPSLVKGTAPVTWSLANEPAGMTINGSTGAIQWSSPAVDGSPYTIDVIATNDYGTDSQSWTLTVIRIPTIDPIDDVIVVEGQSYTSPTPTLTDGTEPVTWSLVQGPAGMTINSSTGVVSWPNIPGVEGPHGVTIRASNLAGHDDETWSITVRELPTINAISDDSIVEGNTYTGPTPALAKGTAPITWALEAGPTGMTIDAEGVVTWTTTTADGNPHLITISATNDWGTDQESWYLKVIRAPVIAAINDKAVVEGTDYVGMTPVLADGTYPVNWTLDEGPAGMTINSNGVVYWPGVDSVGSPHTVTIRATNAAGTDTESWALDILVAPRFDAIADQSILEFAAYSYAPNLTQGTAPVSWDIVTGPDGMTIDSGTGEVSWPSPTAVGSPHTITIRASNTAGSYSDTWLLDVSTAYFVEVTTEMEKDVSGTPITIDGMTWWNPQASPDGAPADSTPAPNVPANIRINVKDSSRTYTVTSDENGQFQFIFRPLVGEAGIFNIYGEHPAVQDETAEDAFELVRLQLAKERVKETVVPQVETTGQVDLLNVGDAVLENISVELIGVPPGWDVQVSVPDTLGPLATGSLEYSILIPNDSIAWAEFAAVVSNPDGAEDYVIIETTVRTLVPSLKPYPTSLGGSMVRGEQTLVKLEVFNEGSLATEPLQVNLPSVPWMSLASEAVIDPLAPGENAEIWLSLAPSDAVPLGNYDGTIVVAGTYTGAVVPFNFLCVSDAVGDLLVKVEDEFTYYAQGEPMVEGAHVVVRDAFTRAVVATGTTDVNGEVLLTNLPESYYNVDIRADQHNDYHASLAIIPGRTKILTAFMVRQVVQYEWKVVPTQIEDRYEFVLETTFETTVPVPVVTIEPAVFDLDQIGPGEEMQVDYTITNHGLIEATDAYLDFEDTDYYEFIPLVDELGDVLPGEENAITVPVIIRSKEPPLDVLADAYMVMDEGTSFPQAVEDSKKKCKEETRKGMYYTLVCGENNRLKFVPAYFEYKVFCPDKKPNTFFPNPKPEPGEPYWEELADYLFGDPGGGGGEGGGLGATLRAAYGAMVNYFVNGNPDITVPKAKDLEIPCSQCEFQVAKSILGGIWDNVPALNKISCAANLGYEAGTAARRCLEAGFWNYECLRGLYDSGQNIKEGCGGPEDGQLKDSLKDIASAVWTHCVWGGDSAGDEPLMPGDGPATDPLDAALLEVVENYERILAMYDVVIEVFGDEAWLDTAEGEEAIFADWMDAFGSYTDPCSAEGMAIGSTEWDALTDGTHSIPSTVSVEMIDNMVIRWNRTISYVEQGIYNSTDVPAGWDPNFIAADIIDSKLVAAEEAAQAVIDEGYTDMAEAAVGSVEVAQDELGDDSQGICAEVRIQIRQEAVITRNAFEATLDITNGSASWMEAVGVEIFIEDEFGNPADDLFAVMEPELTGITDISGAGMIPSSGKAGIMWLIIPTNEAAPTEEVTYYVRGEFVYTMEGTEVVTPLAKEDIIVRPDASLQVKYFHDKYVYADDPFTDETEPSEPFSIGLMMHNVGYGPAYKVSMTSAQPEIIDNEKHLLVDFKIIGAQVGAQPKNPSLTVFLDDILPGETAVARWLMVSSLQGEFTDYDASYVHLDGLGDPRLSLIDSVEIHELIHAVQADQSIGDSGVDDGVFDFLVNDIVDGNSLPDTLYLSDATVADVNVVLDGVVDGPVSDLDLEVELTANVWDGYNYIRADDPGDGEYQLASVIRGDGKIIQMTDNAWTTNRVIREEGKDPYPEKFVHIFDYHEAAGPVSYTLTYTSAPEPLLVQTTNRMNEPVAAIEVEFSIPIDESTFNWLDIILMRDGSDNLIYQPLGIRKISDTAYRITGLTMLTYPPGEYQLLIDLSGIQDAEGNYGTGYYMESWVQSALDPDMLMVESIVVQGDPVSTVEITFSRAVNAGTLNWQDVSLVRDGGMDLIDVTTPIVKMSDTVYRVNDLAALTSPTGQYEFTVDVSTIEDTEGNPGSGQVSRTWIRTETPWDVYADGFVDLVDFSYLARNWDRRNCAGGDWCQGADVTRDGTVGPVDLAEVGQRWLENVE